MEEEISLRELIEVMLQGKWIITYVTIAALLISGVFSFLIIKPTYEARVTLAVSSITGAEDAAVSLAQLTEQTGSHLVMRETIRELGLDKEEITITGLREKVRTEIVKDTNLIRIYAKNSDPELASQIANTVTRHFVNYIKTQDIQKRTATTAYGVAELESQLNIQKGYLDEIQKELENTPRFIEVTSSLANNAFLHSVITDKSNQESSKTGAIQYIEEVLNPAWNILQQTETSTVAEIKKLESRYSELKSRIANEQFMEKEHILITSPAISPEKPIAPRKMLNMAIAGTLGVMLGVFVAFFRHYWKVTMV